MLEFIQHSPHPPFCCARRMSFLSSPGVRSVRMFAPEPAGWSKVHLSWGLLHLSKLEPPSKSLTSTSPDLCSLFQLGLSRRGTHTDKHISAGAVGGKGLVGSLRSRPSTFGVRDTELCEIPRRTWGGREFILQSPNFPSTSLLQPETLSMEEMEIQEDSYSSKHGKGSSLKLTTNTSVCCGFGFHKGSFSQEGSCTHGNGDLWMQLILVTTNKQVN